MAWKIVKRAYGVYEDQGLVFDNFVAAQVLADDLEYNKADGEYLVKKVGYEAEKAADLGVFYNV